MQEAPSSDLHLGLEHQAKVCHRNLVGAALHSTSSEDFFVWIKNLDSHMGTREQFLRGLLYPFVKVLLIQSFQESTVTINTTRETLEAPNNKPNERFS